MTPRELTPRGRNCWPCRRRELARAAERARIVAWLRSADAAAERARELAPPESRSRPRLDPRRATPRQGGKKGSTQDALAVTYCPRASQEGRTVMHHDAQAFGFAIRTTLTVLLVIAAWRFMVVRTMNDTFRQRLFEMRRSLFLLVADGRISPDEPAYRQLCSTINGLLKFAERVTLLRIVLIGRSTPLNTAAYVDRAGRSLAQIQDEEVRKTIAEYRDRVDGEIVLHVIRTSPELWLPLLVMMVGMMSMEAAKLAIRRWAKRHPPVGIRSRGGMFRYGGNSLSFGVGGRCAAMDAYARRRKLPGEHVVHGDPGEASEPNR